MAVFRVEKTKGYTIMSNHHLKNRALALKAKGLLSTMLSLPDDWGYSLKGLSHISLESVDAIRTTVCELEKAGYIVRKQGRDAKGKMTAIEYTIYEEPQHCPGPVLDSPVLDNPTPENPISENLVSGEPTPENPTQLIDTKESNTNPTKTAAANPNQSNPYQSCQSTDGARERMLMGWDEKGCAAAALLRESIHERIEYDLLLQDSAIDKDRLDEIVDIMVETLSATNDTMRVSGIKIPTVQVQERFGKFNFLHIKYVFDSLRDNTSEIRNIKKYLLTTLYNAPSTMNGYYAAKVNHNYGALPPIVPDLPDVPDDF